MNARPVISLEKYIIGNKAFSWIITELKRVQVIEIEVIKGFGFAIEE